MNDTGGSDPGRGARGCSRRHWRLPAMPGAVPFEPSDCRSPTSARSSSGRPHPASRSVTSSAVPAHDAALVADVGRWLDANPGRWIQLAGNWGPAIWAGPAWGTTDATVSRFRPTRSRRSASGSARARIAVALATRRVKPTVLTHIEITRGFWLDDPGAEPDSSAIAARLNEMDVPIQPRCTAARAVSRRHRAELPARCGHQRSRYATCGSARPRRSAIPRPHEPALHSSTALEASTFRATSGRDRQCSPTASMSGSTPAMATASSPSTTKCESRSRPGERHPLVRHADVAVTNRPRRSQFGAGRATGGLVMARSEVAHARLPVAPMRRRSCGCNLGQRAGPRPVSVLETGPPPPVPFWGSCGA